jgi:hypothetical protein
MLRRSRASVTASVLNWPLSNLSCLSLSELTNKTASISGAVLFMVVGGLIVPREERSPYHHQPPPPLTASATKTAGTRTPKTTGTVAAVGLIGTRSPQRIGTIARSRRAIAGLPSDPVLPSRAKCLTVTDFSRSSIVPLTIIAGRLVIGSAITAIACDHTTRLIHRREIVVGCEQQTPQSLPR